MAVSSGLVEENGRKSKANGNISIVFDIFPFAGRQNFI
jgi:hypothetical protein